MGKWNTDFQTETNKSVWKHMNIYSFEIKQNDLRSETIVATFCMANTYIALTAMTTMHIERYLI